jgi:hypothetical protein
LAPRARFELATLRLTAEVEKNLRALSGVAYKKFRVTFPFLVAPNPAPKSGQHVLKDRVRTLQVLSAVIEARCLCQLPLAVVEGPKLLCVEFESAGNVQAVERADSEFRSIPTSEIGT